MAAYDNLGSQFKQPDGPVYHGSPAGFKPGDKIDPHEDRTWNTTAAFGVTNTNTAGYFGMGRAVEPREGQGRLFGSVYEVAPQSSFEHHPTDQAVYNDGERFRKEYQPETELPPNKMPIDRSGFQVLSHAAFAFPDQEGLKKGHLYEKLQPTPGGAG